MDAKRGKTIITDESKTIEAPNVQGLVQRIERMELKTEFKEIPEEKLQEIEDLLKMHAIPFCSPTTEFEILQMRKVSKTLEDFLPHLWKRLEEFTLFSKLPVELQDTIWELAHLDQRVISMDSLPKYDHALLPYIKACRRSYEVVQRNYDRIYIQTLWSDVKEPKSTIFINYKKDIILFQGISRYITELKSGAWQKHWGKIRFAAFEGLQRASRHSRAVNYFQRRRLHNTSEVFALCKSLEKVGFITTEKNYDSYVGITTRFIDLTKTAESEGPDFHFNKDWQEYVNKNKEKEHLSKVKIGEFVLESLPTLPTLLSDKIAVYREQKKLSESSANLKLC